MTERLYYGDSYLVAFDARVVRADHRNGRTVAVLDRTLFYPTSGGQPHDTGLLQDLRVVDVVDGEDGSIEHVIEGDLREGQAVHGTIDWERRFDHMQQHTGQHVLSAAFDRLCGARTASFHLGRESSTVDLDRDLDAASIAQAEAQANDVVWGDRPIRIRSVDPGEAARLPLRKEPVRSGALRLIEVDRFDLSACGGTHVSRTGGVGIIAIRFWERFKGGTRVDFVCGARALDAFRTARQTIAGSVRLLSVLPAELPGAIARLQTDQRDLRRGTKLLQERLASHEAVVLASRGVRAGEGVRVIEAVDGYDAAGLKSLASAVAARPGHAAVLASTTQPLLVVVARAEDVAWDASSVLRRLTERFGGRGGGRARLAQAGGVDAAPTALLDAAREVLDELP